MCAMSIVCGTDFSEGSEAALLSAVAIAARFEEPELWLALETAAQNALDALAARVRPLTSASVHTAVLAGTPTDALPVFAEGKKATVLVVSSRGHGSSPLYRIGGTTERLVQSTALPVLVVRDAAPFEAWARGERSLRILLGVDWTASCEGAIRWVKALRRAGPCDVVVGYVYEAGVDGDAQRRYGLPPRRDLLTPDPETEHLLARDLAARVGDLGGSGEVIIRPKLGIGRTGDHLLDLAETERCDLIVVGTHHKRGFARLASVSSVALHFGHAAVACIPAPVDGPLPPTDLPRFRRVLIATDRSPLSNYAVPHGYGLLHEHEGEVFLVHVLTDGKATSADRVAILAELRSLVPVGGHSPGIITRTEILDSVDPARAICEAAERLGVDVICLCSHGRTGFKRAILGSVTESVIRQSARPVLVVRAPPQ
jgi:nucleotide-binding universal stress UspA family protein